MIGRRLFGRVAEVEIKPVAGLAKLFTSPPFRIDFETDFDRFASTKVLLYNPNEDTINALDSIQVGSETRYPEIFVTAGYKDSQGLVCSGKVYKHRVYQSGADRVVEMQATGQAGTWTKVLNKYYKQMPISIILSDVLSSQSFLVGKMRVGEDSSVNYSAGTLGKTIGDLCKLSKSEYYFEDGKINFVPVDGSGLPSQILLDYTSGLIGEPEKLEKKRWKIQSLFRHEYRLNLPVFVNGGKLNGSVKIIKGKNKFSSHSNSFTEMEVQEV